MRFVRQGKAYQLQIENGNDLQDVLKLDEALWVALSAPTTAYLLDQTFLEMVNSNKSKHISSNEIKDAITWLLEVLPDHGKITQDFSGKIALTDINDNCDNGKAIVSSAKYILDDLSCEDKANIDLATIRKFQAIVKSRPLNGDGILSLNGTTVSKMPEIVKEFVTDAVTATGGSPDVDGSTGVSLDQYNAFYDAIQPYLDWKKQGEIPEGQTHTDIMNFGPQTSALLALLQQHENEIDRFFQLSKILAFDGRLTGKILSTDGTIGNFDPAKPDTVATFQTELPISQPNAECRLSLDPQAINPNWRQWVADITGKIIRPVLGDDTKELTEADWLTVKNAFNPYISYMAAKQGAIAENIPDANLRKYLATDGLKEEGADLAQRDMLVTTILAQATEVERLLLYRANLLSLVNNFVSFPDLYAPDKRAKFERGAAVFDGRWFNTTFPVDNVAAHSAIAKQSSLFVIYIEVQMPDGKPPVTLAAPVTTGTKGNLAIGKQGVFFDLDNREHAAKIVQLIENPVCFREALLAPFTKVSGIIETRISTWASSSEQAFQGSFNNALDSAKGGAAPAPAASDKGTMVMGASVAIAAIGSAFAFISKTISGMSATSIWITVICAILALLLPFSLLAILKLRRQDLSSLLEGNGWAINSRMRMTNKQRHNFCRTGYFPKDAKGTPRQRIICRMIILIVIIALVIGGIFGWKHYKNVKAQQAAAEQAAAEQAAAEQAAAEQAAAEQAAAEQAAAEVAEPAPAEAQPAEAEAPAAEAAPAEEAPAN